MNRTNNPVARIWARRPAIFVNQTSLPSVDTTYRSVDALNDEQSIHNHFSDRSQSDDDTDDDLSDLLDDEFVDSLPVSPRSLPIQKSIAELEQITHRLNLSFHQSVNRSIYDNTLEDDQDEDQDDDERRSPLDWRRWAAALVSINNRGSTASTEGNSPLNQSNDVFDEDKTEPPSPSNRPNSQSNIAPFIPTVQLATFPEFTNNYTTQPFNPSRIRTLASIIERHTQSHNHLSEELFDSCVALRKLLSSADPSISPSISRLPYDEFFESEVLKSLVILFQPQTINPAANQTFNQSILQLQTEIAWIITNVASSSNDHVSQLVEYGVVSLLAQHIQTIKQAFDHPMSPAIKRLVNLLMKQIVWALGNIGGDSIKCRDVLLKERVIDRLTDYVNECGVIQSADQIMNQSTMQSNSHSMTLLRQISWTLRCLISHRPPPSDPQSIKQIVTCLPFIHHCLIVCSIDDEQIRPHLLWILPCITMLGPSIQQAMIDRGFVSYLLSLIKQSIQQSINQSNDVVLDPLTKQSRDECLISSIRSLGCFLSSNAEFTQCVLNEGLFDYLPSLLSNNQADETIKEVCWIVSNIAAGTKSQIQMLIDHSDVMRCLLELPTHRSSPTLQRELMWVLANLIECADQEQIIQLINYGGLIALSNSLVDGADGPCEVAANAIIQLIHRHAAIIEHKDWKDLPHHIIQSIDGLIAQHAHGTDRQHIRDVLQGSDADSETEWATWVSQLSGVQINRIVTFRNIFQLMQPCDDAFNWDPLHASDERIQEDM